MSEQVPIARDSTRTGQYLVGAFLLQVGLLVLTASAAPASGDSGSAVVTIGVGEAVRLPFSNSAGGPIVKCLSSKPKIAQVFNNGFCFGISPGTAQIEFRPAAATESAQSCAVSVIAEPAPSPLRADLIRQFPDNRLFRTTDGRQCYGSELNCRQPEARGTDANRVVNPKPIGEKTLWLVEKDARIVDGAGALIGTVVPRAVGSQSLYVSRFNHGMTKILNDEAHVYSFSTPIRLVVEGKEREQSGVSAWMPLRQVINNEDLLERLHPGSGRRPAVELDQKSYRITGGDPKEYTTTEGTPFKIVKNINTPPKPQDYLVRDAGTINVLFCVPGFGLGGHSLDSFLISSSPTFRSGKGIRRITVPTYYPPGHPQAGRITPKTMTFVYGAVEVTGSPRVFGWVAQEALAKTPSS